MDKEVVTKSISSTPIGQRPPIDGTLLTRAHQSVWYILIFRAAERPSKDNVCLCSRNNAQSLSIERRAQGPGPRARAGRSLSIKTNQHNKQSDYGGAPRDASRALVAVLSVMSLCFFERKKNTGG